MEITTGTFFGEALQESVEDSKYVYLNDLSRIEVKQDGKTVLLCRRREYFTNPPTKEVSLIRELIGVLQIELLPRKDFISSGKVTVKATLPTELVQTEAGFWSQWDIVVGNTIKYGSIKECGNFYDRNADIIIDVPNK